MSGILRVYESHECGGEGYPFAWHRCPDCDGDGRVPFGPPKLESDEPAEWDQCLLCVGCGSIKDLIREQAGHRCVRCGHPYRKGEHGSGEWSPCDRECRHGLLGAMDILRGRPYDIDEGGPSAHARWRILTVHHLTGQKADCRWFTLLALCQRCHLEIQAKVSLDQLYPLEHSDWFKPYAAGWYAWRYLGEELSREDVTSRLDDLLALERMA